MRLITITLTLLIFLQSCGFKTIYKEENSDENISYIKELSAIRIKKDRNRLSQLLKNNLYDLLNPNYEESEPKYFLILTITETISPTFITLTGSSGRNKITLTISYTLKSLEDANVISQGNTSVNDNYDVSENRYGTKVAEDYIKENLTKLAAQNIRNSLVNDLIEFKQRSKNPDIEE